IRVLLRKKDWLPKPASDAGETREGTSMARPAVLTVADTIANSFLLAAETRGDRTAIREKKFGVWQPTSWRQWLQISKEIAYGLHAIGFRPGTSPRSSRTRYRNGYSPIWASCAPAAFHPESIRPIPAARWNILSMTPAPG